MSASRANYEMSLNESTTTTEIFFFSVVFTSTSLKAKRHTASAKTSAEGLRQEGGMD